jgi:hypothetical protein
VPQQQRRVDSIEAAESARFAGSPTLRLDGDPDAGHRTDYGLKSRLYPTNEGLRGAPPDEWVLNALDVGRPAG